MHGRPLRVVVQGRCDPPCPACAACNGDARPPSADEVRAGWASGDVVLGGGDALRWPALWDFLAAERPAGGSVWVEAPAGSFTDGALARLASARVAGVVVQIEATGRGVELLGVGDGEAVIARAEALGLSTRARACVRPATFGMVVPLARRLAPREV
jgi:hypothetical protein